MTRKEKLNMIEDVLEVELGSLKESDLLSKISEYDSMSKLSLIVMCDEEFEKKLRELGGEIKLVNSEKEAAKYKLKIG